MTRQHGFKFLYYTGEPEHMVECLECGNQFDCSPHTEEGLYLGPETKTLYYHCPSCGQKEPEVIISPAEVARIDAIIEKAEKDIEAMRIAKIAPRFI
jgi:uncharacterized Zn finger protein